MSEYNGIQEGGANSVLARRLNTEAGAPAPNLAPEVLPIIPALEYTPDLDYWAGVRRCAGYAITSAVAGNYSGIRLRNPVASRTIIVVNFGIVRGSPTGISIGLLPITNNLASGATNSIPVDTRIPTSTATTQTVGILSSGVAGTPSFTTSGRAAINLNNPADKDIEFGWVLGPGTALDIWSDVVNISIAASLSWTERTLNSNELG